MPTLTCYTCRRAIPMPEPERVSHFRRDGSPLSAYDVVCPRCETKIHVEDYGRCDGISNVRGFAGILTKKKAIIRSVRAQAKLRLASANALWRKAETIRDRKEREAATAALRDQRARIVAEVWSEFYAS